MKTISISALFVLLGVAAFGQINFPDGSTATTGELTDVTIVQAGGTAAANGTALRAAMDAISGANASAKVIQLAAGTYNLGGNTLTMKPFTHLRGVGKQATIITGSGGELLAERDVNGSAVTGISVGSGTQVILMNTTVIARVNGADSVAVSNSGGFRAFSTFFQGTIPNPAGQFFNSNTDSLLYSQCSQGFTDI